MAATRHPTSEATLVALDVTAQLARQGFACLFASSDEFEADLIAQRRAEGRYRRSRLLPIMILLGCGLTAAGAALLMF